MEMIIGVAIGLLLGILITYLFLRTKYTQLESECQFVRKEKSLIESNHAQYIQSFKENTRKEIENLKESFDVERRAMIDAQRVMKENFEETKLQMEKQWKEKIEILKAEFQHLADEVLEKKSGTLQNSNKEQLNAILNPLKEKMQSFEKAVKDNQISGAENKASLEKAIEEVMKRAQEIGNDAVNLTKALRGNSKTQGDWGEMVLESILEKSGLRKNEEYFVQESATIEGERVRPDVIVRFPEKRSVVIDSKVSLSAYVNYVECNNEKDKAVYLKNHIKSIKDHIDELNVRNYSQYIEHSIGYVLMFIPNEASYILAVQNDASLGSYAYDKRIVLISPTNMMMALQLAYNLWQSERQSQNVQKIVKMGSDLYDKFATFVENFTKIGAQLNTVQNTYDEASKQLSEGKGNLAGRIEKMRELGLNPKKQLSGKITSESEE